MKAVWLVALAACGPGLKQTTARDVATASLVGADAATIESLLDGTVVNGGLHASGASDPACAQELGATGLVAPARFSSFARCIAALGLRASSRKSMLDDVAVLTYGPGFEVEARIVRERGGSRLRWIGFASRRDGDAPTISSEAFEALRTARDRHGPKIDGDAVTWMHVCIDATGAVTSAEPRLTSSFEAVEAFTAAARAWTFRPFVLDGKPTAICSMVRMAQPPDTAIATALPLPPRGDHLAVTPQLLDRHRRSGANMVVPDGDDMTRIQRAGGARVRGDFHFCVDATGRVDSVTPISSTGLPNYDRKIVRAIQQWTYAPPRPACTVVTFIYSQR